MRARAVTPPENSADATGTPIDIDVSFKNATLTTASATSPIASSAIPAPVMPINRTSTNITSVLTTTAPTSPPTAHFVLSRA